MSDPTSLYPERRGVAETLDHAENPASKGLLRQLEHCSDEDRNEIIILYANACQLQRQKFTLQTVNDPETNVPFTDAKKLKEYLHTNFSNKKIIDGIRRSVVKKLEVAFLEIDDRKDLTDEEKAQLLQRIEDESRKVLRTEIQERILTDAYPWTAPHFANELKLKGGGINARTDLTDEAKRDLITDESLKIRGIIMRKTLALSVAIEKYSKLLRDNPHVTADELRKTIEDDDDLKQNFSQKEIANIQHNAFISWSRERSIGDFYSAFKDKPELLFEIQFGFKPRGEIELQRRPFGMIFLIYDEADYDNLQKKKIDKDDTNTLGTSYSDSPFLGLQGRIISINCSNPKTDIEKVIRHELTHSFNRQIYNGLSSLLRPKTKFPAPASKEQAENQIKKQLQEDATIFLERAKDEILAYMKENFSSEDIKNKLVGSEEYPYPDASYHYWEKSIEDYKKLVSDPSFFPEDYFEATLLPEMKKYHKAHVKTLERALDFAFKIGPDRALEMAITPIANWGKLLKPEFLSLSM